jgi:hypothetical protein
MGNNNIFATSLRGFCNIDLCWKYIADISAQLSAHNDILSRIDLCHIYVNGYNFILENDVTTDEKSNVWLLAASAIELINGTPILNGKGEKSQTRNTPLPLLSHDNASDLNHLLSQCLNFDKAKRPTMAQIAKISQEHNSTTKIHHREKRIMTTVSEDIDTNEIDRLWPEAMMSVRNFTLFVMLIFASAITSSAQSFLRNYNEPKMQKILSAVLLLRNKTSENVDNSQDLLSSEINEFTLMDELKDPGNDCMPPNSQRFGVNLIVNELKRGRRVQASEKELLSGTDSRFAYSLFEKGVKMSTTATYNLSKRSGQQCFIIVPFSASQTYNTELYIGSSNNQQNIHSERDENGITYYVISAKDGPKPGETIRLKITNKSKTKDASFVIINHNYRNHETH